MEEEGQKIDSNEIVEIDENEEVTNTQYDLKEVEEPKKKEKKPNKFKNWWSNLSKKKKIIIICSIVLVLLIIIGIIIYFAVFRKTEEEASEPIVIVENDNYRYEDGTLIFINEEEQELGSYECTNKDEELCYVAYYSDEDDFDVVEYVYEDGSKVKYRSDIYLDRYVFIYDNSTKSNGTIVLYDIKSEEITDEYDLVKKTIDDMVIVVSDEKYGLLTLEDTITTTVNLSYDYMGYIEDKDYLVVANNNNYQLIDFEGNSISKTVPGEIKNYDSNSISVYVDNDYYVYNYYGKSILEDEYDYVTFVNNYIVVADSKRLYIFDKDGYNMNLNGIKVSSNNYNTKVIFSEDNIETDKEESFSVSVSNMKMTFTIDDEETVINLYEGEFNKTLAYISYFEGLLYFYSDEEKTELIGTYTCSYANSIDSSTTELTNCFVAKESNLLYPLEELENGYLPIYNERYVFIADTKSPNANDNIVLYDLKNKKSKATYMAVDAGYHENGDSINFEATAGTIVLSKNLSSSYGLINIGSSDVTGLIAFKNDNVINSEVSLLGDYLLFKRSDGTYHLYDTKGNEITSNITTTYEIVEYNGTYIMVKSGSKYLIYDLNGKIVSSEYQYIIMADAVYITVNNKNILGVYKYDDSSTNLIEEEITLLGDDLSSEISYSVSNNVLLINYTNSNRNKASISVDIS